MWEAGTGARGVSAAQRSGLRPWSSMCWRRTGRRSAIRSCSANRTLVLGTFHASKIGQSQQGHLEREASFADKRSASQFGLIALIGARDAHADVLGVEKQVAGWRRRVLINHKLALQDAVFGRVRAGEVCERAAP